MKLVDRHFLLLVIAIFGFVLGVYVAPSFTSLSTVGSESGIKYWSEVCVRKNGELIQCSHNVFTNQGKNLVRDYISGRVNSTAPAIVEHIAVGNGTAPAAGDTILSGEIRECGLSRSVGSYRTNATDGIWFLEKVFTVSTCGGTIRANTTGLFNTSSATISNYTFASNSFTNADLQNNDQLNITWTIAVT